MRKTNKLSYNERLGKQVEIPITNEFTIFLQAQITELITKLNSNIKNIAISLVGREHNNNIYNLLVYQQDHKVLNKVAKIYLTDLQNILKCNEQYRIQAVRLYKNDVCDNKYFKDINANSIDDLKNYTIDLVKNNSKFKMIAEVKKVEQTEDNGQATKNQVVVRLTEDIAKVNAPNNYRPVIIEYIYEENEWDLNKEYRLSLIRFPQDIYENNYKQINQQRGSDYEK